MNPYPVQLKYEKIYYPCILASKKRYVGYKYENPNEPPVYINYIIVLKQKELKLLEEIIVMQ